MQTLSNYFHRNAEIYMDKFMLNDTNYLQYYTYKIIMHINYFCGNITNN